MSLRSTWNGNAGPPPEMDLAQTLSRVRNQFPELRASYDDSPGALAARAEQWQSSKQPERDSPGISLTASMPGRRRWAADLSQAGATKWERDIALLQSENAKIKEGMARASERLQNHKREMAMVSGSIYDFGAGRSPYDSGPVLGASPPDMGQPANTNGAGLYLSLGERNGNGVTLDANFEHGALFSSAPAQSNENRARAAADAQAAAAAAAAHVALAVQLAAPRHTPSGLSPVDEDGVFSDYPAPTAPAAALAAPELGYSDLGEIVRLDLLPPLSPPRAAGAIEVVGDVGAAAAGPPDLGPGPVFPARAAEQPGASGAPRAPSTPPPPAEGAPPPPPPPSRTDWTRLVPPSVLIGYVSSIPPY